VPFEERTSSGFTLIELVVTIVLLSIIGLAGTANYAPMVTRISKQAEAERLVRCLRWLREMARSHGRSSNAGYGVFFWRWETASQQSACFRYSPYVPLDPQNPASPTNDVTMLNSLGRPSMPVTLGNRPATDLIFETNEGALANGFRIFFQTDLETSNGTPYENKYPDSGLKDTSKNWNGFRILFWPPGQKAPLPWPSEPGVTLPRFTVGTKTIHYNRIYLSAPNDLTDPAIDPATADTLPARIRIDPGTGITQILPATERRPRSKTW